MSKASDGHTFFQHCLDELSGNPLDISGLVAALICLIAFFGLTGKNRLLLTLPILSYVLDVIGDYYSGYLGFRNNLWIYNYCEIPLLIYTFYVFLGFYPNNKRKAVFGGTAILIILYHLGYVFVFGDLYAIDVEAILVAMVSLSVLIYLTLYSLVDLGEERLLTSTVFWFLIASFVFYIGRVPITALTFGATGMSDEMFSKMYVINDALMVFWYCTTAVGVLISSKWMKKFI